MGWSRAWLLRSAQLVYWGLSLSEMPTLVKIGTKILTTMKDGQNFNVLPLNAINQAMGIGIYQHSGTTSPRLHFLLELLMRAGSALPDVG